ncbi:GNAT family protein [Bradyrhizobium prioriisuperbiae]|uniref:GNAT family N-acetyltransferase n=1 Tax=Bradyrhizobium prioriisuperbiae TaxID=2854389 RepID=UPI0028E8CD86|nr:GNAT family protein [Bradyrhizobium prioritasuperba]
MTANQPMTGPRVELRPLEKSDGPALVAAANDGELWRLPFTVVPSHDTVETYISRALAGRDEGHVLAYVIVLRATGDVVGTTRFWKVDRQNRKLEIGHTWIAASWQRSFVNTEMKFLMLRFAFETLCCVRVQFTTDEINSKSRAAILRLGATEEGCIRNERIMPDGRLRNSIRFSIIATEWPDIKKSLEKRLSM